MDARKIPKGYYIPKNFEEITLEHDDAMHYLTHKKYLKVGSYVMVKDEDYFMEHNPFYGFSDDMLRACGWYLKIKSVELQTGEDYPEGVVYELKFEEPPHMARDEGRLFTICVESWSWNNEMVIPLVKTNRNIKI